MTNPATNENQSAVNPERQRRFAMRIYILPNLMTTGNLFCGFYAILHAIQGDYVKAAYWICGASVFDFLDGRLARLTRATSKFGAEYDSLSDLVSFCVAPAIMLYLWALQPFGRIGWLGSFLFVTCGALRLARFNVQANVVEKNYFQGLPTPMAAGIVASSALAFQDLEMDAKGNIGLLIMTYLLAFVMVSTFKYRSFKDLDLKERLPFKYLVLGIALLVVVLYRPEVNLFILFLSYAVLGAVTGILGFGKNKKIKSNVYLPAHVSHDHDLIDEDEEDQKDEAERLQSSNNSSGSKK